MFAAFKSLSAIPLVRDRDVVLAAMVAVILSLLIVPLPTAVLDVMLACNISLAALILMTSLLSDRPLALSSFPSLLLITTLFRLSLNVSTTRLILSEARAGEVVAAFGQFVARSDVILGLVVFAVLTVVQLMVIGKGAERVAEVGARFTLDAMPGKQMSIDAAIRNGALSEEEGEARRVELQRESQFYGAMDGAMKFIKGDAVAGLIMTALNLVAGLIIGILRFDMPVGVAAETYCVLTIGDGLVSQVPSLLITLASGVLTTRVAGSDPRNNLSRTLDLELFSNSKILGIAAAFAAGIGLIPGLPTLPFITIAGCLAGLAWARSDHKGPIHRLGRVPTGGEVPAEDLEGEIAQRIEVAKAQRAMTDQLAPTVAMVAVDLGPELSEALGLGQGRDEDTELMSTLMPQLREAVFMETGVRLPGIRVRSQVPGLVVNGMAIKIKEVPVAVESIDPSRALVIEAPAQLKRFGVDGAPAHNPVTGQPAALVPLDVVDDLSQAGLSCWRPAGVVALYMMKNVRQHLSELVGLQETAEMLERLEQVCGALVREVVPKVVTLGQLAEVLQRLVEERVSIRDLKTILESLGRTGGRESDVVMLTEFVRADLSLQLAFDYAGHGGRLGVVLLDSAIEEAIADGITHGREGSWVALEPDLTKLIEKATRRTINPVVKAGVQPIVMTHQPIRRYVRKLLESSFPELIVLSFEEMHPTLTVQPLGRVRITE